MGNEMTGTVDKDGALVVKDGDKEVRYVKETDLLAVKGSRDVSDRRAKELEVTSAAATAEIESHRQKVLQAEAKVESLEEQIAKGGTKDELAKIKQELEAAKKSGEELSNKALGYRRAIIIGTYGVPVATVEKKTMAELDHFEEALKAVIGTKGIGNYAAGGGGGGANPLVGKSPMELAQIAYATKK